MSQASPSRSQAAVLYHFCRLRLPRSCAHGIRFVLKRLRMVQRASTGFASHRHAALFLLDNVPGFVSKVLVLPGAKVNVRPLREGERVHPVRFRRATVDANIPKSETGHPFQAAAQTGRQGVPVLLDDAADCPVSGQGEGISRCLAGALSRRGALDRAPLLVFGTRCEPPHSLHGTTTPCAVGDKHTLQPGPRGRAPHEKVRSSQWDAGRTESGSAGKSSKRASVGRTSRR